MRGSLTSQSTKDACDYTSLGIAFRHHGRRRHSDFFNISRLNTPPACAPVNASLPALRLWAPSFPFPETVPNSVFPLQGFTPTTDCAEQIGCSGVRGQLNRRDLSGFINLLT